jgi:hypothetical protein
MALPRRASRALVAVALALCAFGAACRQTVLLDPEAVDGAVSSSGAAGSGPVVDSGADEKNGGNGGNGGTMGGGHFDGGSHPDVPYCFNAGPLQSIPITPRTPDIIVSVDRSTGMQAWFGTGTRLDVIQQQVQALVSKYRGVKFGYQEFPAPTAMCGNQGCCAGDVGALPNYNNNRAVGKVIHACDSGGAGCMQSQRPIADALSKCFDVYHNLVSPDETGHRYVILLTSGDPMCPGTDAATACSDAVSAVAKLSRSFTTTAVFGVGDGTSSPCLDMLALYGGVDSHIVKTPNDLSGALSTVVETIAEESCKIDVHTPPADPKKVQLLIDNIPVPYDPVDGWTFDQDTNLTLTVHGDTYCRALVQSGAHVELVVGCLPPHN